MKLKIKGINDGIMIALPGGTWEECYLSVQETVSEKAAFFKGANLFLDAGKRDIRVLEMSQLREMLGQNGIRLTGICGISEKTRQNALSLGLLTQTAVTGQSFRKAEIEKNKKVREIGESAYCVYHNVHSGTVLKRKERIVVIGDVNPGAEVISAKDVIVWGKIRGKVSAGLMGGEPAEIRAFGLEDAQIMINGIGKFFRKDVRKNTVSMPMILTCVNGEILTEGK